MTKRKRRGPSPNPTFKNIPDRLGDALRKSIASFAFSVLIMFIGLGCYILAVELYPIAAAIEGTAK